MCNLENKCYIDRFSNTRYIDIFSKYNNIHPLCISHMYVNINLTSSKSPLYQLCGPLLPQSHFHIFLPNVPHLSFHHFPTLLHLFASLLVFSPSPVLSHHLCLPISPNCPSFPITLLSSSTSPPVSLPCQFPAPSLSIFLSTLIFPSPSHSLSLHISVSSITFPRSIANLFLHLLLPTSIFYQLSYLTATP